MYNAVKMISVISITYVILGLKSEMLFGLHV